MTHFITQIFSEFAMQVKTTWHPADLTGVSSVKMGAATSGGGAAEITIGDMSDVPGSLSTTTEEVKWGETTGSSCPICPAVMDAVPKSINWLASTELFFSASSAFKWNQMKVS